jgi:tetratricopeptide (TPR) repeat protein
LTWGHAEYRPALEQVLRTGAPADRARAAFGLALIGSRPSRGALASALAQNHDSAREWAGLALCYLGDPRGAAETRRALNVSPWWVRYYALVGLWRLDSADARAFVSASQSAQGPFLQAVMPHALQSTVWQPPTAGHQSAAPLTLATPDLWEALADQQVLTADFWWHSGDYDQCCEAMESALFFCPDRVDLYDNVAWLEWSLGRDKIAVETLERGIAANPDSWMAKYNLGFHYFNTKRYEQSLPYLRACVGPSDKWCVPAHICAHALEYTHHTDEALKVWQACCERFPDDAAGKLNRDRCQRACDAAAAPK